MKRNINGEEAEMGECNFCGKDGPIYAPNFLDPYITELSPETPEDQILRGNWCESCWSNRKEEI